MTKSNSNGQIPLVFIQTGMISLPQKPHFDIYSRITLVQFVISSLNCNNEIICQTTAMKARPSMTMTHTCIVLSKENRIRIETSRFGKQMSNGKPCYVAFSSVPSRSIKVLVGVVAAAAAVANVACGGFKTSIQSYSSV